MEEEKKKISESLFYPIVFVVILWLIKLSEEYFFIKFVQLGILPRTFSGFYGIVSAPLIHGDINHLGSNSVPLLMLGFTIFYFYRKVAFVLFVWIYIITGLMVWIAGDGSGYHIGASGLIYGFIAFLFFSGIFRKDKSSMALAMLVTFVYGGMIWGIFPLYEGVSWESHLFGALCGSFCAWNYKHIDPPKKFSWEEEDEVVSDEDLVSLQGETLEKNPEIGLAHYVFDPVTGKFYFNNDHIKGTTPITYRYFYRERSGGRDEIQDEGSVSDCS